MDKILHESTYHSPSEMKNIVRDYYKNVFSKKRDRHVKMQELFPSDLNQKSKILDYGCGMGGISSLFQTKYKCSVDGIEISRNELAKARITFGENSLLNFLLLDEFTFPKSHYDMIFSAMVIEHVHNPGNYLSEVNNMLKKDGYLLIGLPNIVNLKYLINLILFTKKRALKHSQNMIDGYRKESHHINGWDPLHFVTLAASCGFKLVDYLPTEGTPITDFLRRIPFIGKYIYIMPFTTRLSYTMFFLFKKEKDVAIENNA